MKHGNKLRVVASLDIDIDVMKAGIELAIGLVIATLHGVLQFVLNLTQLGQDRRGLFLIAREVARLSRLALIVYRFSNSFRLKGATKAPLRDRKSNNPSPVRIRMASRIGERLISHCALSVDSSRRFPGWNRLSMIWGKGGHTLLHGVSLSLCVQRGAVWPACGCYAFKCLLKASLTTAGLARPRIRRMTWPTKKAISLVLPPRKASTSAGFSAMTARTTLSMADVSDT